MSRGWSKRFRAGTVAAAIALAATWLLPHAAAAATMPDAWITTKVKMALLMAEDVSSTAVRVDTVDGKVTLHGTVSSTPEKQRAEKAARSVEGVQDVRNLLAVVEKGRQDAAAVGDQELKSKVANALSMDPTLADSKVAVQSVNQGVVLLSGTAATMSDHLRALEVARGVPGVRRVASEIKSPDTLGDEEIWMDAKKDPKVFETSSARDMLITSAAKLRLIADGETPARDINVDTSNGVVTLFGTVPSAQAKTAAETDVKKVDGVHGVENHLQVVPPAKAEAVQVKDDKVKGAIEERIGERTDLRDSKIDVEVSNGVARLTGTVASQGDRLTALTIARSTSGVRSVVGDLAVKPQ